MTRRRSTGAEIMSSNSFPRLVTIGSTGIRSRASSSVFVFGAAGYAAIVGYLAFHDRRLAMGAAGIGLIAGLVADNLARLAVIATAGVWLIARVPGDVSLTDVLVAVAGLAAALSGAGEAIHPRGRLVLRAFAFYLATLSVTLAYNHSFRSDLEWFHRIALVGGAISVGAWLVVAGLERLALRSLLAVTAIFAALAFADGLASGLSRPAQPLGYQKNFVGSIIATVLLLLLAAHRRFGLSSSLTRASIVLLLGGLISTHSRGAMVALCVGVLVWFFRGAPGTSPRLRAAAIAAAVGVGVFAGVSVWNQEQQHPGQHSSLTVRSSVARQTRALWIHHPWTGVGLKFFKKPQYAGYLEPTNVADEIAAEAGVFGIIGFFAFVGGALVGLGRLRGDLATAAVCVVAARFAHGLFDIYWGAGTTTLTWIVAGMGLASAGIALRTSPAPQPEP
jgi:hypothetical protein